MSCCPRCGALGKVHEFNGSQRRVTTFDCGTETFERLDDGEWGDTATIRGGRCQAEAVKVGQSEVMQLSGRAKSWRAAKISGRLEDDRGCDVS